VRKKVGKSPAKSLWMIAGLAAAFVAAAGVWLLTSNRSGEPEKLARSSRAESGMTSTYKPHPTNTLTFARDIAPIVFDRCAPCHRPGQTAPFALLTLADVKKHAKQIAEVTANKYMPPWLPESRFGEYVGDRRLNADQLGMIQQWVSEGAPEGSPAELPPLPQWKDGWQLGAPDLVVTLPSQYMLPAAGKDVYRNFVIPIPITERRYVKAVEFNPASKSVHHSFFLLDRTRRARRLQKPGEQPGFPGMSLPEGTASPAGQFLSWHPGQSPSIPEDLAWTLEPDTDLVLQVHMQTIGKPESVQPSMAFYFTDAPSSRILLKLGLSNLAIDIPAGAENHLVRDSFELPVDAEVLAILPHAHYLGKELQGFATLPDGTKKSLLRINNWDFNWQNDYRFVKPVFLPKGSTVTMQYTYDNSTNNVRNPSSPPRRVQYGVQTTDEMAELWIQFQFRTREDLASMEKAVFAKAMAKNMDYYEYRVRLNPADAEAHGRLGEALLATNRKAEALSHFQAAIRLDPKYDLPHYHLGLMFRTQNRLDKAREEFETAIRLNPENAKAHGNLGFIFAGQGDLESAELQLKTALELNPNDTLAANALGEILRAKKQNGVKQ